MLVGDFILWSINQNDIRSVSGNSGEALLWAGVSLVVLFVLYQLVNTLFRQSVLPLSATEQQLSQSVFQTVYQSITKFSGTEIDFSQLKYVKYYLFGVIIPLVETRVIGRIYGAIGNLTNINISDLRSPRTWSLIAIVASLAMWFHLKVRGINNNIDLVMTMLFFGISLVLIGKFRELESANELHIGWNLGALLLGK